jgi:hypothetical protein
MNYKETVWVVQIGLESGERLLGGIFFCEGDAVLFANNVDECFVSEWPLLRGRVDGPA